ncbi:MAG: PBSX family phage terminase large subunit [Bacilli bacterium]|jgi:PBSX family phage terminase large subunit
MQKTKARRVDKPAFVWKPPSPKQEQILYWWTPESPHKDFAYFEAEGSVRCGKTALADFSFTNWASFTYDQEEFALCSKTIGTAIRNQVRPLMKMLSIEPSYEVQFKRSQVEGPHLIVHQKELDHENTFWIYGGKDESSQDLIQGKTLAGILFDEPPLMPQSFINQGLARLSVEGAKAWFLNNPETPTHPLYVETLDPFRDAGKLYFLHLTMDDNPALSDEARNRITSQWPVGSVLYRRYVLGERAAAEGRVFSFFEEDISKGFVVDKVPADFIQFIVSLDYGYSNPFSATLWGLSGGVWYILQEFYWDSKEEKRQKSNAEYIQDLDRLTHWQGKLIFPNKILIPPEEPGFIKECKGSQFPQLSSATAADNSIMPGIEDVTTIFSLGRCKIYQKNCPKAIWGINNLLWDPKAQERGVDMFLKGGSGSPDHVADGIRYGARRAKKELVQMGLI